MKAGTWHRFLQRQGRALSRSWAQPPSPASPMLGRLLLGTSGSFHVALAMLTAHSLLTARVSCTPRGSCKRLNTSELQIPAIHSTHPTGCKELEPHTEPEAPQSTGAACTWSHYLAPVLCCSSEHCWGEKGCSCRPSCPLPHPSGLHRICLLCASRCTHLAAAAPKLGSAQNQSRGRMRVEGRIMNPLHEGCAGRAQLVPIAWGWLCPAVWDCSSAGEGARAQGSTEVR